MLGSQQFCVRWNSYQTNLQDVFPKLLNSEHFVDVTLACEAQMIKCHKVVLSACSTYFEELLVKNPCQHPIIFMKDMKHWEVQALVDFMYKGEVNVTQEEISTLLKAAEALQIRGLCGADRQQDSNAVSLPPETTLSDSGGRETPPVKRRKFPEQQSERNERREKQQQQPRAPTPKPTNATPGASPLVTSTPTSSNDIASVLGVPGPVTASVTSTPYRDSERNNTAKETTSEDVQDRSNIKREQMDQDDSYFDNDGEYDSFDIQDDSNSMNPDISMPTSPLDQAGPSGVPGMQETKPTAGRRSEMHQQMLPHGAQLGGSHGGGGLGAAHPHGMHGLPGVPVESLLSTPTFSAGDFDHDHQARMNMNMGMGMMGMGAGPGGPLGGGLGGGPGGLGSPGKARIRRSEEQLRQAADCVVEGSTFQTVSDRFGIPISTIRFYMARRGILPQRRRGRSSAAGAASNNQSVSAVNPFHQLP